MKAADTRFMSLALNLGARGLGRVWPNPSVGCVIVAEGRIVGRGWTQDGGRPHGETMALAQAGAAACGATAYVTLEPCAHHGQTPPCAQALIEAGIARVVVARTDPDPRVDGGGVAMLRAAGIEVVTGILDAEATAANSGFLKRVVDGLPLVTLKLASSLDGRIATATGESQWITSPEARRFVHAMRANHDGVMVGGGTARTDDPSLNVRDLGIARQPVRIVISRRLDLPMNGNLARTANEIPVWICHGEDADREIVSAWDSLGAKLFPCTVGRDRHVDPKAALRQLAESGLTRIFCEGGGALAASLLNADLVDDLVCFTAGMAIGAEGQPMLGALGLNRLADAQRFRLVDTLRVGADILHKWSRS